MNLNRRGFLLAAGSATVLAGCGNGGGKSQHGSNNSNVKLPGYDPFTSGPKADLAPSTDGVLAGYLKYPADPPKVTSGAPSGGTITAFVQTYSPVAPGLGRNKYWQALNKAMGVNLKMSVVPSNDYSDKLQTMIAGNALPDMFQIRTSINELPQFLATKCQELSGFLSGSADKEYPFLANIPSAYWKTSGGIVDGGFYGIPVPRSIMGGVFYYRADIVADRGLDPNPSSYAEFEQLCKGLNDTRHNKWALANADAAFGFIQAMMGVPNAWKNSGGKLISINELEQTKEALDKTVRLVKAGYVHPDSFASATTDLTTQYKQWFNAGSAALDGDNWTAWPQFYVQNVAGPKFRVGGMLPPNYDSGSTAVTWQGTPDFSYTVLKKDSASRIKAVLKVLNWLATPFGSAEYLLRRYGVENVDWIMKNGDPVQTDKGAAEVPGLAINYLVDSPAVLYYPGQSVATRDAHTFMQRFLPKSVADPTIGLYSPTNDSKGGTINNNLTDARHAIMQGRKPVSAWDDAVKAWRQGGGDQIAKEFEEALQKGGS